MKEKITTIPPHYLTTVVHELSRIDTSPLLQMCSTWMRDGATGPVRLLLVVIGLVVPLSGCVGSQYLQERPSTLEHVNHRLRDHQAVLVLVNDSLIVGARNVRIGPEVTEYRKGGHRQIPTSEIVRVNVRRQDTIGAATLIGAAPGLLLMTLGVGQKLMEPDGEWTDLILMGGLILGTGAVIIGGFTGGVAAHLAEPPEWVTVYEGPVSRYPDVAPSPD